MPTMPVGIVTLVDAALAAPAASAGDGAAAERRIVAVEEAVGREVETCRCRTDQSAALISRAVADGQRCAGANRAPER